MELERLRERAARAARLAYRELGPVGPQEGLGVTEALGVVLELQGGLKGLARRLTPGAMHSRTALERLRVARVLLLIEQLAHAEPQLPLEGGEQQRHHELQHHPLSGYWRCAACGQVTFDPEDQSLCPGVWT